MVSFLSAENEDIDGGRILLFSASSSSSWLPGVDDVDDSCTTQGVGKEDGILPYELRRSMDNRDDVDDEVGTNWVA
jgi:hypothetical protein